MYMRIAHYEIKRQADGGRLAVYTVEVARRRFIVTRRLGSAHVRFQRRRPVALIAPAAGAPALERPRPNPNTRRRRGFGAV